MKTSTILLIFAKLLALVSAAPVNKTLQTRDDAYDEAQQEMLEAEMAAQQKLEEEEAAEEAAAGIWHLA